MYGNAFNRPKDRKSCTPDTRHQRAAVRWDKKSDTDTCDATVSHGDLKNCRVRRHMSRAIGTILRGDVNPPSASCEIPAGMPDPTARASTRASSSKRAISVSNGTAHPQVACWQYWPRHRVANGSGRPASLLSPRVRRQHDPGAAALPPRFPEFNPIDGFWQQLKNQ